MYLDRPVRKKKKRRAWLIFFILVCLLSLIAGAVFFYFQNQYHQHVITPVDSAVTAQDFFQVKPNEDMKMLARRLKEQGLVENDLYFWWYLRSNRLIPTIQAGTHYLSPSYNYATIAKELGKARPSELNVTIPEGYRIDQIDARLVADGLIEAGDFIEAVENFNLSAYDFLEGETLEGYLFPDTYRVFGDSFESKGLIVKMVKNFKSRVSQLYQESGTERSMGEIVTMASIIEKETNNKDKREIVAGILWKRLEIGMLIGADATTRYAVEKFTEPLTVDDLDNDSPYNTRKVRGLPPGAICNPGLASLKAAMYPETSEYLYYLHDANGEIHYGRNNEDHNANKRKYL